MSQISTNYMGVPIDVQYDYCPAEGDGHHDEHIEASFTIEKVFVGGVNLIEMLTGDQLESIEEGLKEQYGVAA